MRSFAAYHHSSITTAGLYPVCHFIDHYHGTGWRTQMSERVRSSSKTKNIERKCISDLYQKDGRAHSNESKSIWIFSGNQVADLITLSRCILALSLLWIGLVEGRAVLVRDIWILVLAWSTDIVDGQIARSLNASDRSWVGRNDVYVDMFFSVAVLVYLASTGFLPIEIMALYLLVWAALFLRWGIPTLFAQVFQNPIYAYFVYLTVKSSPSIAPWLLLWALVFMALFWRRLFQLMQEILSTMRK
jgi:cardiolipin synthase (CMP-forming)